MTDSEADGEDTAHFTCIWAIENMCPGIRLHSPVFTVPEMEETRWHLSVYTTSGFIQLIIYRHVDGPENIEIMFELSFLGIDGLPLINKRSSKEFRINNRFQFKKFADPEDVFVHKREEFLPRGVLRIRCRMWRTGAEISRHETCFARTLLREFLGSCLSRIRDFSTLRVGQKREVDLNPTSGKPIPFTLQCFIREEDAEQYLCIDMKPIDTIESCNGKFEIFLLDAEGNAVHSVEENGAFGSYYSITDFFEKHKLSESETTLLPDDVLTLKCEYEIMAVVWRKIEKQQRLNPPICGSNASEKGKKDKVKQDETLVVPSSFTEAIKALFDEGALSDVNLRAGSKSFPAHKCILYARSPVFRTMFSADTKENTRKCVDIPDLKEDTLKELLSYIYSDTVGELEWRRAIDLYKAADKYKLPDLKTKCATTLKSNLSVNNVCVVLTVADLQNDRELLEAAQDFIMRQGAEFITSDTFQNFAKENIQLAMETMERLLYIKYLDD